MPTLTRRTLLPHFEKADPIMARLIKEAGPYRLRARPCTSPFKHLAKAIASQQISSKVADTILKRFVKLYPLVNFPKPSQVLATDNQTLRGVGFSAGKVRALKDLARHTQSGLVPNTRLLEKLDDEDIILRLTQVHGIGPWTVQMMLMFQMGRLDVLPKEDYGIRNGFRITYNLINLPTPGELAHFGERWAPYRSAAAWYLWRAVDLQAVSKITSRKITKVARVLRGRKSS